MKLYHFLIIFLHSLILSGCFTLSDSWAIPSEKQIKGTVWISSVETDMTGSGNSIEKESARLLPLLLSEHDYIVTNEKERADYLLKVILLEREYINKWNTINSSIVEVYFYHGKNSSHGENNTTLPIVAVRAINKGSRNMYSSKYLHKMLKNALAKAVAAMEVKK